MEISDQIRRLRTERSMSQDDLAKAIFVSRQTVCNWETDKTYPDVQSILLLSQVFGVSTDELIKGDVAAIQRSVAADAASMKWLSAGMAVLVAGGVVCFVALVTLWRAPSGTGNLTMGDLVGAVLFAVFWGLGMLAAVQVERIKSKHDLVTYREIMAFYDGTLDEGGREGHGFARSHPAAMALLKFLAGAAVGAFVGIVAYMVIW